MVARLTPDQKVACSNHVGVTKRFPIEPCGKSEVGCVTVVQNDATVS